ncbi:protein containing Capsule synthesis protein, CapA domain [sediment metagenome]|uniref:Protein containing Capsule synthesis protein, CapA domain n=1 Tax=sediment metagenome TaxID=749907 RepID=D9PM59_9ZZZZ
MILLGDWAPGEKKAIVPWNVDEILLANLEGPILPSQHGLTPSEKAGPVLFSTQLPSSTNHFIFTLANNHLMDYGLEGFEATQTALQKNGFIAMGAGLNLADARNPAIITEKGEKIAIISCCDPQFGIAGLYKPGVAGIGPWIYSTIRQLLSKVDAIIVSVHMAIEDSPWPNPRVQEIYRSFIEAGASIVHGHHSHIPQGFERYYTGLIFYGMGNFLVDPLNWRSTPNALWSFGAKIHFETNPPDLHLLTFNIKDRDDTISVHQNDRTDADCAKHLKYLDACNGPLKDPVLLEALWHETALRAFWHYGADYMGFHGISGKNAKTFRNRMADVTRPLRQLLIKRVAVTDKLLSKKNLMLWHLMTVCESHRDMLATALGILAGEIPDMRNKETRQLADEMMPWSVIGT